MWEIKVEVNPTQAERLDEFLAETEAEGWHVYAEAYGGKASLIGYFEDESAARTAWADLKGNLPREIELGEPEFKAVEDQDWKEAYKEHFHPWQFGSLHWVPVWERETFQVPEGGDVVWLDPGMAFGTGNHETTRLCAERLIECAREWKREGRDLAQMEVLDAGCGSGILAVSAVKCGFEKVGGFDNDPVAVETSEENAELNGLAGQIDFYEGDLVTGLEGKSADLLLANIQADVLCRHARDLKRGVRSGGRLILSGILASELEYVRDAFVGVFPEAAISSRELGEWADLLVEVP